jgi:hypothetical protein
MSGFTCWVPSDNDEMREHYHQNGRGGTCGPASIAAERGMTVREVLENWKGVGPKSFRGFSPIADMKETLEALGYQITYIRGGKAREFPTPKTTAAILRIQWLQEDGTQYYWRAAGSHTHYVLMKLLDDGWWIFCNSEGWFRKDSQTALHYLEGRGFVSSYMELVPSH